MSKIDQKICFINPPLSPDKNLVYKGTKYHIEFDTLKKYSNYFYTNRKNYKHIEDIEIKEVSDIKESDFQNFVSCCQNRQFIISDSNAFSLYQLSVQYEVPLLIQKTEEYIKANKKSLILESIFIKIKQREETNFFVDLEADEKFISSNIFEFIDNEQMQLLPIPVLYRILSRTFSTGEMNDDQFNQIVEFLFKCLDKRKREASILFTLIDLKQADYKIFGRLVSNYSEIFDFAMINSKYLIQTTSQLLNEMNKLKIEFNDKIKELNQIIENQNDNLNKLKSEFTDKINEMNRLIETQNDNLAKMKTQEEENKKQVESLLNKINENNEKERGEFKNLFEMLKEQMRKENQKEHADLVNIFSFNGNNQFSGIINYLKNSTQNVNDVLSITASSFLNNAEKNQPQNVINFGDNKNSFLSKNEPDSWIRFDFKKHRIIPTNYTIRTAQMPYAYNCYPKRWVIEGSADGNSWEVIDTVNDCSELNGEVCVHNFPIKSQSSNKFRYIQMRQTGKTWNGLDFLCLGSFELFGKLFK